MAVVATHDRGEQIVRARGDDEELLIPKKAGLDFDPITLDAIVVRAATEADQLPERDNRIDVVSGRRSVGDWVRRRGLFGRVVHPGSVHFGHFAQLTSPSGPDTLPRMGDHAMTDSKIFVAGHRGLVGSAIVRNLEASGHTGVLRAGRDQIDLVNQANVDSWFEATRPEYVYLVAGKVGGIMANSTYPAEFIYENLMIATNVIEASRKHGVTKLLYLGSSCIYPRLANQPMVEGELLTGELEKTNEPYALAKIAGIKLCEYYKKQFDCNFVSAMPTNLYGPNDNFDLENSHVLPALMRKFHEAKHEGRSGVEVWGTGSAMREFLYVDDLADACVFLMNNYDGEEHINVGTGTDVTIKEM